MRSRSAASGHCASSTAAYHKPARPVRQAPPACDQEPTSAIRVASQKKPFERNTPVHSTSMNARNRAGWNGRRAR